MAQQKKKVTTVRRRKERKGKDGQKTSGDKGSQKGNEKTGQDPDLTALEEIEKKDQKEGKTAL